MLYFHISLPRNAICYIFHQSSRFTVNTEIYKNSASVDSVRRPFADASPWTSLEDFHLLELLTWPLNFMP